MIKKFVEMINIKIEEEESLTIGMEYGSVTMFNSIIPDSINIDHGIYLKGEWLELHFPEDCEIEYDDFEEEYIIKYNDMFFYFLLN